MPEPTSAEILTAKMTGQKPEAVEEVVEEVVDPSLEDIEDNDNESTEDEDTNEENSEEELPQAIKDILAKNRAEAKAAKAELARVKKELEAKTEASDGTTDKPADDRYKNLFINTAAKSALMDAGLSTGTDRFLKMIDLDAVSVDEDGNVEGLEEQVTALSEEFKDLIAPAKPVRKIAKTDAASRRETVVAPKSSAEQLAARVNL